MEALFAKSALILKNQQVNLVRPAMKRISWKDRLIGLMGARGTGKTTLILQQARLQNLEEHQVLYLSMDDIYFAENNLSDVVAKFRSLDGKFLLVDEVHKYPNWAREIKNAYDFYPDLKIVFTGSSIVDMLRQDVDLSRRAVRYFLPGLSFREYLQFTGLADFPVLGLNDLLKNHTTISLDISDKLKPLLHFNDYLKHGYYPFFMENIQTYPLRLQQVVNMSIENDLQFIEGFDPRNTRKIFQLLFILSVNVPFKPNISHLSEKIGISRNTLLQYLHYLEKAKLISMLSAAGKSVSILQKPDKLYLENTNLQYAFGSAQADKGTLRESFFLNQLRNAEHIVVLPKSGDFFVDDKYTFEAGGRGKKTAQIKNISNAYIVADDIETGALDKIPLWLFGFLY